MEFPISVNGATIAAHQVDAEVQYHPAASREAAQREAARALVVRALLLGEARRQGLWAHDLDANPTRADAEAAAIAELTRRAVPVPAVPDVECERFYAEHRERFRSPDLYEVSHILVLAPVDDKPARAHARKQATELLDKLAERPRAFHQLAKQHSGCPSGSEGGRLGQVRRGELPEIEHAFVHLTPGELANSPVPSRHGYHVVRLDERVDATPLPFEAVADRIRLYLRDAAWRRALHAFIATLSARAELAPQATREALGLAS